MMTAAPFRQSKKVGGGALAVTAAIARPSRFPRTVPLLGGLLLALVLAAPAHAADVVGRVISRVGQVTAVAPDGERRPLQRRSEVREGETVVTGPSGRAQVRFKDQGLVDLKPDSRFTVKRYRAQGAGDGEDSAVMELLKGGMRTITGAVGGGDDQQYRVETPLASIGIRGTQYVLRLCRGDCGEGVPDGLYCGVSQGTIAVRNAAAERTYGGDRYVHVPARGEAPRGMLAPPGDLFTGAARETGDRAQDLGISQVPDLPAYLSALAGSGRVLEREQEDPFEGSEETDGRGGIEGVLAFSQPGAGFATLEFNNQTLFTLTGFAQEANGDTISATDSGVVTGLQAVSIEGNPASFSTTGSPAEVGRDSDLGITWARWAQADVSANRILDSDVHFAFSENLTAQAHLDNLSGSATYTLSGSTTPTASGGTQFSFDSVQMGVDFNAQTIQSVSISVSGPANLSWTESSSVPLTKDFVVDLQGSGNGKFAGHFVGARAEGALFSFQGIGSTWWVVGSGALKR